MGAALVHGMVSVGDLVEPAGYWRYTPYEEGGPGPQRSEDTRRTASGACPRLI